MKLAFWTPAARAFSAPFTEALARSVELTVVTSEAAHRPPVELDVYHVANDAAHGFVYRALLERPGLVLLESWELQALVFAETAGRGAPRDFLREARRERGESGAFIARQILRGWGGALTPLLPLNQRVIESAVALATTQQGIRARAQARLAGRPSDTLALDAATAGAAADALVRLARGALALLPEHTRALEGARALEHTPLGRGLAELRSRARELGLGELPRGLSPRIAALLPDR